jgi:hypothetical protein
VAIENVVLATALVQATAPPLPPERWLCERTSVTGFAYDAAQRRWHQSSFRPEGRFLISAQRRQDVSSGFQWAFGKIGDALILASWCGNEFLAGTFLHCRGLTGEVHFNRRNNRYIRSVATGYFNVAPGLNDITDETSDTPILEIGSCSQL